MKPVFYTSGPSRCIHMGNMEIRLQHVSVRRLTLAGRPAGLALTALWYLGKEEVNNLTIEKIQRKISPSEFEALKSSIHLMPAWMSNAFIRHERARNTR